MNDVEVLDEAISYLEYLVNRTTPGDWKLWGMGVFASDNGSNDVAEAIWVASTAQMIDGHPRTFDAQYICSMHPGVGVMVLSMLKSVRKARQGSSAGDVPFEDDVMRIARAIVKN